MAKKAKRTTTSDDTSGGDGGFPWSTTALTAPTAGAVALFALLVRVMVSVGPYSGEGTPPKYGDYEAQRHWMEITLHTPASEWYRNTSANDLAYWGLDYPPLTAYQSLGHGLLLNTSLPDAVALSLSRGFESPVLKLLMRWTVLSSDLLLFFPAALYFVWVYCRRNVGGDKEGRSAPWLLAMILLNPCLILIDHGHFQYNCISLGLTLGAIAAVLSRNELVASALFSLAINHKQVLSRLAPFERGIYEDYVANFWCSTSIFIKWKRLFPIQSMKFLSLITTVSAFLPSFIQQVKAPSDRGFLYALLNSSFSFYLFSYQVHEKSILLPLLPASLLALEEPLLFGWLMYYALLSMYPLLCRDHLILQYISVVALFGFIFYSPDGRSGMRANSFSIRKRALMTLPLLCSFILHVIYLSLRPPKKYPFLFEAMIMLLCFSQFVILTLYTNTKQLMLPDCSTRTERGKKDL
ncbi:probable dolichyl pyrophosphate Man9GlcNAc2 alpha-1,3-glucosyltransferase isoform X2 [Elaeis guineensis]|uniref:probable dolichyl pyrophosphate Man9GlcNAc2 alpha-1,3-glucosyltransferase isoform X2 n=1 Tax=Elaeis guineensis var. tenera TaxID=51953 RepID=UPI003C6D6E0E